MIKSYVPDDFIIYGERRRFMLIEKINEKIKAKRTKKINKLLLKQIERNKLKVLF